MNRAEIVARGLYESNRRKVERGRDSMDIWEIMRIAEQQDELYKIIYRRWDCRRFE